MKDLYVRLKAVLGVILGSIGYALFGIVCLGVTIGSAPFNAWTGEVACGLMFAFALINLCDISKVSAQAANPPG